MSDIIFRYENFSVTDPNYTLNIGGYFELEGENPAGDSLGDYDGVPFTTYNRSHDVDDLGNVHPYTQGW